MCWGLGQRGAVGRWGPLGGGADFGEQALEAALEAAQRGEEEAAKHGGEEHCEARVVGQHRHAELALCLLDPRLDSPECYPICHRGKRSRA